MILSSEKGVKAMPHGIVKEVGKKYAIVHMERQDMCGDCHACEAVSGKKDCTLRCEMDIPCSKGDKVEILLAQSTFLKATYIMYGVPLLGLIVGIILGYGLNKLLNVGQEDLLVLIGAIIGTGTSFLIVKWGEQKGKFKAYLPRIISKK